MPAMTPHRVKPAEYLRTIHVATPEAGTTVEDLLDPTFWAHCARGFHISDRIEVIPEDNAYYAELYVQEVSRNSVKVVLFAHHVLAPQEEESAGTDEYAIRWSGPHTKYRVVRKKDNAVLQDGFTDTASARKWLSTYENV